MAPTSKSPSGIILGTPLIAKEIARLKRICKENGSTIFKSEIVRAGRSRGGFSTKIHLATDALGNALRFILTGGQRNDITQAEPLVEDLFADYVIADKGYDSEAFVLKLNARNSEVVIPSRISNRVLREIDEHLYKERHLIENQIGKLKQFCRVFSRFDKLTKNYLSFIYFASTLVWLR